MNSSLNRPQGEVAPVQSVLRGNGVILVHHWMEFFRGGEAVLEQFAKLFPEAPIAMMMYETDHQPKEFKNREFRASFLQRFGYFRRHFRKLLPIFPEIIRSMRAAKGGRFILSSDASLIKGIPIDPGAIHVCYCHSPPRYLWGMEDAYLERSSHSGKLAQWAFRTAMPRLKRFDFQQAKRVDRFIANSECVKERIKRCYNRESIVIHPPVNVARFDATRQREDFYLVVSALVPYKRIDLAVDACVRLGRKLIVIGIGPEYADLVHRSRNQVTFLGWQPNKVLTDHYERCRAFLFPGIEDFGITPCEAQAAGAPVIAYGEGGALETVKEGVSGHFFSEQTVESMMDAIVRFEEHDGFPAQQCRKNVEHLGPERFRAEIEDYLLREFPNHFTRAF